MGLGMVCRGEVALIVANKGIAMHAIHEQYLGPIIIMIIACTILSPAMLKAAFRGLVYYITNIAKSLCCGLEQLDDDVIWANGDVIFDEGVIERLLSCPANAVAVDKKKCGDEEVKYRAAEDKKILEISKTVACPQGEAVGVNMIRRDDIPVFLQCLASCADNDYFERGLELAAQENVNFTAVDISDFRCIEVDFEDDLQQALSMFA